MSRPAKDAHPPSSNPEFLMPTPRILSGIKPTGKLHIGNYFGMMRPAIEWQDRGEAFYFIADYHALTTVRDPAALREHSHGVALDFLACGLDPAKAVLFRQSDVPQVTELAWILTCMTPMPMLENCHAYKDYLGKDKTIFHGLFAYPVLMAADILLYNADAVPVGEDQKQHLELARDLAEKFNRTYSPTFKVPEPFIAKTGARIASLSNPEKKMSKSDEDPSGTLYLNDPPATLRKKIMSAVTDSGNEVLARDDKPGVTNLLHILSACIGRTLPELEAEFAGQGYGAFKGAVADTVVATLEPVQKKYAELMANKDHLLEVIKTGGDAAQKTAYKTLAKVYRKVGFLERGR
jgi:tryptophanyl-tRNA synthetase